MGKFFFAVRPELLKGEKKKIFLEKFLNNGRVLALVIYTDIERDVAHSETTFLENGVSYDATKVERFSEEKRSAIIDKMMEEEKEKGSLFFPSIKAAITQLESM